MSVEEQARRERAGYMVAVAATAIVAAGSEALRDILLDTAPFIPFVSAVMLAGWYAGLKPGLLATALSGLSSVYLLVAPRLSFRMHLPEAVGLGVFLFSGILISLLSERLHKNARELEAGRRDLHQALRQLHTITDTMSAPVTLCTRDLRYAWVSKPYADWIGCPQQQIVGRPIVDVLGKEAFEQLRPHFERVLSGHTVHYEELVLFAGPGPRWINAIYTPTTDETGLVDGWIAVVIDVHDRRNLEDELRRADSNKNEFLAILAHELRNPLAPILNAVAISKTTGLDEQTLSRCRDIIERQVRQLVRLVDDLMDVSRISRRKLTLHKQTVELSSVIEDALETSGPLIRRGRHQVSVDLPDAPITLHGDPVRLAQVFANLLNNAAKYTNEAGRIHVAATLEPEGVAVSVKDTGIGLDPEMLPRLFRIFSQAPPARERSQGGLGIGLSLARSLVELHGGTIEARSEGPGTGSEFVVRLPIGPSTVTAASAPSDGVELQPSPPRRVLIVDDHHDGANTLSALVSGMGHEVCTVHDGLQAVEAARSFRPDVVLLDLGMPRLDGWETARIIRRQPDGQDVLLIAVTGWGQDEDRRRSEAAGFDHHLLKPVDERLLRQILSGRPAGRSHPQPPQRPVSRRS